MLNQLPHPYPTMEFPVSDLQLLVRGHHSDVPLVN